MFHDEPTVDALSLMGLEVSAVGNHEFDKGLAELERMQNGGCHPKGGCQGPHRFTGAKFHYLAANVTATATGKTILPPYYIKRFDGIPVAFIGLGLKDTPALVAPAATQGLQFEDEAKAANALVPRLKAQGVEAIVVLVHDGGIPDNNSADYNGCPGLRGTITDVVARLDKAIDVVISGHSHQAYNCVIDGRLVTSAHRYGTMVTEIHLTLDARTRDVTAAKAENLIVRSDTLTKDASETDLIAAYQEKAAPIANHVVGRVGEPLLQSLNGAGESALGDMIADAELAAARKSGAVIGFINAGGIRSPLGREPGDAVTHADIFAVQPFSETLVTLTLTGAQLKSILEEQWTSPVRTAMLEVSRGFSYAWDAKRPPGDRVLADSLMLNGAPIRPEAEYRVALPDFLADGPDSFTTFRDGKDRRPLMSDLDAAEAYLRDNNPLPVPETNRIRRVN
jgi:5'-nucleotidase